MEPGRFVAVRVVPFVEAFRPDVGAVSTVFEDREAVVPPWPREENGAVRDPFFPGKAAVPENEAIRLLQRVSGRGDKS